MLMPAKRMAFRVRCGVFLCIDFIGVARLGLASRCAQFSLLRWLSILAILIDRDAKFVAMNALTACRLAVGAVSAASNASLARIRSSILARLSSDLGKLISTNECWLFADFKTWFIGEIVHAFVA
jgi:hypothetical protein